jgi:hypothetical protein
LCRSPRPEEVEDVLRFLASAEDEKKMDPLTSVCLVLFNTNEFVYRN